MTTIKQINSNYKHEKITTANSSLTKSLVNLQMQYDNQEKDENASSTELLKSVNNSTASLNVIPSCQEIIKLTGRFTTSNSRLGSLDFSSEEEETQLQTYTQRMQQKQKSPANVIKSPNKSVPGYSKTRSTAAQQYRKIRHESQSLRMKTTDKNTLSLIIHKNIIHRSD